MSATIRNDVAQTIRFDVSKTEVLVVDDDELVRSRLQVLVGAAGYQTKGVATAKLALAALRETTYPIVLMDRMMSDMDGLELCRVLRSDESLGRAYVIMLSVCDSHTDLLDGFRAGVDAYLSKSAPATELLATLRIAREHAQASAIRPR